MELQNLQNKHWKPMKGDFMLLFCYFLYPGMQFRFYFGKGSNSMSHMSEGSST